MPTVHGAGRNNAKVERGWHLEENLKFIDLRGILRSRKVEIQDTIDRLFAGRLANAQVRWLPTRWTDPTGLDANLVEAAVLWPGLSEPMRGECRLHAARKEQVSQRSLDTKSIQDCLLLFPAVVTQVGCRLSNLAGLSRYIREGAVENQARGAVVPIHVGRGESKLRADPFKAMPKSVFVQLPWLGRIIANA